jgi:hypothetical protein
MVRLLLLKIQFIVRKQKCLCGEDEEETSASHKESIDFSVNH